MKRSPYHTLILQSTNRVGTPFDAALLSFLMLAAPGHGRPAAEEPPPSILRRITRVRAEQEPVHDRVAHLRRERRVAQPVPWV